MPATAAAQASSAPSLLNASYDPTRKLYQDYNAAFGKKWQAQTGTAARFEQWNYLAAWSHAVHQPGGGDAKAKAFVEALFKNVSILNSGSRGATLTFVQRGQGDVLIAWENEAFLSIKEFGADQFEIVVPSSSILCEPPVAWVDKIVERHGT